MCKRKESQGDAVFPEMQSAAVAPRSRVHSGPAQISPYLTSVGEREPVRLYVRPVRSSLKEKVVMRAKAREGYLGIASSTPLCSAQLYK